MRKFLLIATLFSCVSGCTGASEGTVVAPTTLPTEAEKQKADDYSKMMADQQKAEYGSSN